MSKGREISDYLNDILNACAEVEEFTRGMDFESFEADKKTVNAVIRGLEILGEAQAHSSLLPRETPGNPLEQNGGYARRGHSRLYGC